jgi:hypothetical protein
MNSLLVDFIPIFLVYAFAKEPVATIQFSGSTLGKLIAICLIAFYTSVNATYGIFVCLLVLVYYQTDLVEEILNMDRSLAIEARLSQLNAAFYRQNGIPGNQPFHGLNGGENPYATSNAPTTMVEVPESLTPKPDDLSEGFRPNDASLYAYTPVKPYRAVAEDVIDNKEKKAELMAIFRKDHCVAGRLVHRGGDVQPEMTDHVFREIRFDDEKHKCNVCDPQCGFSIIEERLSNESDLRMPKSSNDFWTSNLDYVVSRITDTTNWLNAAIPLNSFVSA